MLATERCLMTKQRRTFTPEFKREAACLVLDQGYSHTEAARSLGLVESALRRWVSQLQQERGGVTPTSKALTPEQQKIQELEARINRLDLTGSAIAKPKQLSNRYWT
jgi:transposase